MGPARFPVLADLVLVAGQGLRAQRSLVGERQLALLLAMPVHEEPLPVSAPPPDRVQQTMIMKERVRASRLCGRRIRCGATGGVELGLARVRRT